MPKNSTARAVQDRFAGQVGYPGPGDIDALTDDDLDLADGSPDRGLPLDDPPRPSLSDLDVLAEPVLPASWLDAPGALADHPLLRGLLLELPPKGMPPQPGWLDRWFEAARSILELLYVGDQQQRR